MPTEPTPQQSEEIADLLRQGRKIQAIKLHRSATGLGLKEAKEFIDRLEVDLRHSDPDSFQKQPRSCGSSIVIMLIFAIALATLIGGILTLVG